jgi:hypothetical protein
MTVFVVMSGMRVRVIVVLRLIMVVWMIRIVRMNVVVTIVGMMTRI